MAKLVATASIRSSITLSMMLVTSLSLVMALGIQYAANHLEQEQALLRQTKVLAEVTATNAAVSLLFDDASAESRRLRALANAPEVETVQIFKRQRGEQQLSQFASYHQPGRVPQWADEALLDSLDAPRVNDESIQLTLPVLFDGENIGQLYMRVSTAQLNEQLNSSLTIAALSLALALLFGLVLAVRQQRRISRPLELLASVAQSITQERDFSLRAPALPLQELQVLGSSFNKMLERVERQLAKQHEAEQQIRILNENLEQQVQQRTGALKEANSELLNALEQLHLYQTRLLEQQRQLPPPPEAQMALAELDHTLLLLELTLYQHPDLLPDLVHWSRRIATSIKRDGSLSQGSNDHCRPLQIAQRALQISRLIHPTLDLVVEGNDDSLELDGAVLGLTLLALLAAVDPQKPGNRLALSWRDGHLHLKLQLARPLTADEQRLLSGGTHLNDYDNLWAVQLQNRVRQQLNGQLDCHDDGIRITIPCCIHVVNTL